MKTITKSKENEIIIKNSRFICCLFPLENNNIDKYMNQVKEEHPKATHYTYAYIYDNYKKSSDDNEPSGTAGLPLLNVLEKEELNHMLVIVVRYFGGIKLGAGGLVRAYTKSLTEALKNEEYQELENGLKIILNFTYDEENNILYILKSNEIINKKYLDKIEYTCLVNKETFNKLSKYNPTIIEETIIKKA